MKIGRSYIVVARLKRPQIGLKNIMCLAGVKKLFWSEKEVSLFRFDELPDDKMFIPWRELTEIDKKYLTTYPCREVKPFAEFGFGHLSQSIKSPGFLAYANSPNQLAYRVAKNAMMIYKDVLGNHYDCRVYRVGQKECPVSVDFGKECLYEKRMYELYSTDDKCSLDKLMKTFKFSIKWNKLY